MCSGFIRALSSAGLEHLPYKQRVGGSNPSAPTGKNRKTNSFTVLFLVFSQILSIFASHRTKPT